jgi:hypothetical protein
MQHERSILKPATCSSATMRTPKPCGPSSALREHGPAFDTSATTFRAVSQPGPGLTLSTREVESPQEVLFEAELRATTADGRAIVKRLAIPVQVLPMRDSRLYLAPLVNYQRSLGVTG